MSHKKFGPDRFSRSAVLTFIGYKQTDRQAKFIYRLLLVRSTQGLEYESVGSAKIFKLHPKPTKKNSFSHKAQISTNDKL